jgi:hypothetical protein
MMKNHKQFDKNVQGSLDWHMHGDWRMAAAMWKYKKTVCLISTHARPKAMGEEKVEVPWRNGQFWKMVKTSPIHLEYKTHMRGVDVVDHLRGNYSCQVRSHKWWHRSFYFMVDTTMVNSWILHKEILKSKKKSRNILCHFDFILGMIRALTANCIGR